MQPALLAADADEYSVTRSLEAYLLWLFGYILFNNTHGNLVDRILLPYAHGRLRMGTRTYRPTAGVRQYLQPLTVDSATAAERHMGTLSWRGAHYCCNFGRTRG